MISFRRGWRIGDPSPPSFSHAGIPCGISRQRQKLSGREEYCGHIAALIAPGCSIGVILSVFLGGVEVFLERRK